MSTVLIIDDSRAMRSVLRRMMTARGFETLEAGDGQQALDILEEHPVDLCLVDWNMPVLDGYEFLKQARAQRRYADLTIVMVSAENDPNRIARALMAGADEYVMKPLTEDILDSKLAMVGMS